MLLSYGGLPVSAIAGGAFRDKSGLKAIRIPNSVVCIYSGAFSNCVNLTSVTFQVNSSLQFIQGASSDSDGAFFGCTSLKEFIVPASVRAIGESAFSYSGLTNIVFENGSELEFLGPMVFQGCNNLASIKIPCSLTEIGNSAFYYCKGLKEVTFEENSKMVNIGQGSFIGCSALESIVLPESVSVIQSYAFSYCSGLKNIEIYAACEIGSYAFYNTRLESIHIPDGVKIIKDYAFSECDQLTTINIPDSVTEIGQGLFMGADRLKEVTLSKSLTSIPDYVFYQCSTINNVFIPEKVTSIGKRTFYGCRELRLVTIPNVNTEIAADAFLNTGMISVVGIKDINYTLTQSGADFTIYFDKSYETLPALKVTVNDSSAEEVTMQKNRCTFKSKKIKINDYNYITCSFTQLGYAIIGSSIEIGIRESCGIYESAYRETVDQCQTADVCMLIPHESEYYFKIVYSLHNRLKGLNMILGTMCASGDVATQEGQLSNLIDMGKTIIMVWEVEQGCLNDYMSTVDISNTLILLFNSSNEESIADYYFLSNYYLAGYEQACHIIDSTDNESNEIELFVSTGAHSSDDYQVYYSGFVQALNDFNSELLINEHIVSDKDEVIIITEELTSLGKTPAAIVFFEEYLFDEQSCCKFDLSETMIISFAYSDETLYSVYEGIIDTVWYFDPESVTEPVIQILEGGYVEEVYYIDFIVVNNANVFDYLNEGI